MKKQLLSIFVALMAFTFIVACPKSDDMGDAIEEPKASESAPATEINAENAEAQADAILKDIDNL